MTVTVLDVAGRTVELDEGRRRDPASGSPAGSPPSLAEEPPLALLLVGGALSNDALLEQGGERDNGFRALGDPTEGALVVAAAREGLRKPEVESVLPRVSEVPFDSERKRMTTVHKISVSGPGAPPALEPILSRSSTTEAPAYLAFTKGAVDGLLEVSSRVLVDRQAEPLDEVWRERISSANERLAGEGVRVLGVAFRPLESPESDERGRPWSGISSSSAW
jgi:Ca2+-transporting ATPase